MNRRNFIQSAAFGSVALRSPAATSEHPVPVKTPRSTSGDPIEPNWTQRLTLTVGPKAADLIGSTEKVVQAAVDSIARWGGGTVKILPGNYHFRNAVYLQNNVRILGSGLDSVITKQPSMTAKLSEDSDWFDQEITFADAAGLEVGDGISWQICHDVLVEDCDSHDHTGLGLHPGSGSQRSIIRRNRMSGNDQGLFFCWGVKWALAEKNQIENSKRFGISIGHHDTDNVIRDNDVRASGEVGILFRKERAAAFQGHRNRIENNRIVGVVKDQGVGIDVQGQTRSIAIVGNQLRENKEARQRVGIRIGAEAEEIKLDANRIEGFSQGVVDLRA
jgi:hypothetical protein